MLRADLFLSVDGYAGSTGAPGYFGYWGPGLERWVTAEMDRPHRALMGRHTYSMLASLPESARDEGWRRMTQTPTTVFSTTLAETSWPAARIHGGDVVREVAALKANGSDDLRTVGSLSLVRQLLRAGLVDRLRLMIFPVIVGTSGREPFFSDLGDIALELDAQTVVDDRLILLEYQPAGTPPWGIAG